MEFASTAANWLVPRVVAVGVPSHLSCCFKSVTDAVTGKGLLRIEHGMP